MKKLLILVLSIVYGIILTACASFSHASECPPKYPYPYSSLYSNERERCEVGVGIDQNGRPVKIIMRPFNYEDYYYGTP